MMKSLTSAPSAQIRGILLSSIFVLYMPSPRHSAAVWVTGSPIVVPVLVCTSPLFYLIRTPKCKSSDVSDSDIAEQKL